MTPNTPTTHFGYEEVATGEKAGRVRDVFDSVAQNYDLMNDLMSGGLHRLWKRFTLTKTGLRAGDLALDVAGGTADLTAGMSRQVGASGLVCLTDINAAMLERGRRRLVNDAIVGNATVAQANAECLPFADDTFHCITIGFGLILEFSKPALKLVEPLYEFHLFKVLPMLGRAIAKDAASYQYLAESIRMHPDQKTLLDMMSGAGLEDGHYYNLAGGIVALHIGYKY